MALRIHLPVSETLKKRSLLQRMVFLYGLLILCLLLIVARLIELQLLSRDEYTTKAQQQHLEGVVLPARRGEILARNSKTGETMILATNITLDLVYVDPLICDDPAFVAETLSEILITDLVYQSCAAGSRLCSRELLPYFSSVFDPLQLAKQSLSGSLMEPLPVHSDRRIAEDIDDITEIRRRFARDVEQKISEKRVTFVPLKYGATKPQMEAVSALSISGISLNREQNLVYANPEQVSQQRLGTIVRQISPILEIDPVLLERMLRSRPLRYVSVMRQIPPKVSIALKDKLLTSLQETSQQRAQSTTPQEAERIVDPLRSVALIPEHWRYYPDATIASQVVGFLNTNQEAQYGIERTFDPLLRGQEGLISSVSDLRGGQIVRAEQKIINAKDGDTIILTIDPFIQREVETILTQALERYQAESGQVVVMDPSSGRILALANVPLFDRNAYGLVYEKEPLALPPEKEKEVVVELYHPESNVRIVKAYASDVFTQEGRARLSEKTRAALEEVEKEYDLQDITRYYTYLGENVRREIFPTALPGIWLKFRNNIGVGAYLNRTIQEIYEPGSVMKPITMASAIDQGEVVPEDTYNDTGPVQVDEYTIKNALLIHYGVVTMTNCLEFSINTCMTSVSAKLGKKLFHRMIERFGFGKVTNIELEDELPGAILPWRNWSNALLSTAAFGQGISSTPLQMITAFAALANGGKLVHPTIVHSTLDAETGEALFQPSPPEQIITPSTSETITAMLVSSVNNGYAKTAKVPGYRIAGKTGTSQIAGPGGRYESGTGSTIASFLGYAPTDNPKFVVLVKIDRPKHKATAHGAGTAAPTFKEIATFLFKYYGIPPDEE
jgi:cell division protein FtsI/penicillin-binding protein 2